MPVEAEIRLDRVELEDVGGNPERLAAAIHRQLGERTGKVDVHAIAQALDIGEIREDVLNGMEAALVTTAERSDGSILVNSLSSWQRKRFSIAHELGHFLIPHHRPTLGDRFNCTRADMRFSGAMAKSHHQIQEAEANRFAIEVLTPRDRLRPHLSQGPNLRHALALADEFGISREAGFRRYVALHRACLAVVFSRDGRVSYPERGNEFPPLSLSRGQPMPQLPDAMPGRSYSAMQDVEASDWLCQPRGVGLRAQCLYQQNGYVTTLLLVEADERDDVDGPDDLFDSITRRHGLR